MSIKINRVRTALATIYQNERLAKMNQIFINGRKIAFVDGKSFVEICLQLASTKQILILICRRSGFSSERNSTLQDQSNN
uniref:CSON013100 protein n=1 Tax=Culicoides sonorensis TaxID=179676 RepID=A0A336M7A6_CULSO